MNTRLGAEVPAVNSANITDLAFTFMSEYFRMSVHLDCLGGTICASYDELPTPEYYPEFSFETVLDPDNLSYCMDFVSNSEVLWMAPGEQTSGKQTRDRPEWTLSAWSGESETHWSGKDLVPEEVSSLFDDFAYFCSGLYHDADPDLRRTEGITMVVYGDDGTRRALGIDRTRLFTEDGDGGRSCCEVRDGDLDTVSRIVCRYPLAPTYDQASRYEKEIPCSYVIVYVKGLGHYTIRWTDSRPEWVDTLFDELWEAFIQMSKEEGRAPADAGDPPDMLWLKAE